MSAAEGWGSGVHSGREGGGGAETAEDGATCAAELSKIPQPKRRVDGEDFVIICSAIVPDEGRNQKPSEVIRGHQRPSVAISMPELRSTHSSQFGSHPSKRSFTAVT